MPRCISILVFILISVVTKAQITNKIGYQEFPTTITGQATDSSGNIYYNGSFKGQLKVDGQVLGVGQGLGDLFVVKTDSKGKAISAITFGSKEEDYMISDALCSVGKNLVMAASITSEINFQSIAVSPYRSSSENTSTGCIISLNPSGNVEWVNKTNLLIMKVYSSNNILHVLGAAIPERGDVKYNDETILKPALNSYVVHLMLDSTGKLINYKTITSPGSDQRVQAVLYMSTYSDGKLCMLMETVGNEDIQLGNRTLVLPKGFANYFVMVKTDTSYNEVSYKVLNSNSDRFTTTSGVNEYPITLAHDSVYLVLTSDNSIPLAYDGIPVDTYRKNALVVLDPSLKAKRVVNLGNSFLGAPLPYMQTRRIYFNTISRLRNNFLLTGVYCGANESPVKQIVRNDVTVPLFANVAITVDQNGGSKSFAVKAAFDFTSGAMKWIGDHTPYETGILYPRVTHQVSDSLVTYSNALDNVWNPWIIDQNLNVINGSMRPNADMVDLATRVEYLPDGSRIMIGTARGLTALDSSGTIVPSNSSRNDIFITRITSAGEVKWFKRINSTLTSGNVRTLVVRDNKAYFLVSYFNGVNEANYLQADSKSYNVNSTASLLASVDTSGNITVINQENNAYKTAFLNDFTFFPNGDLAVLTSKLDFHTLALPNFPGDVGFYVLRVAKETKSIISARKFLTTADLNPTHIEVDGKENICLSIPLTIAGLDQAGKVSMHNGSAYIDSVAVENNIIGQNFGGLGIFYFNWNKIGWYKRTSGLNGFRINSALHGTFMSNGKIYFIGALYRPDNVTTASLSWDNQLVIPSVDFDATYLFKLNESGKIELAKPLKYFTPLMAKRKDNGSILISGYTKNATTADALTVGFEGATDAVGFSFDSTFTAKSVFRLATSYSEAMLDMDISGDTLVSFAYSAQTEPVLKENRFSRIAVNEVSSKEGPVAITDYEQEGFVFSQRIAKAVVLPLRLFSFEAIRNENRVSIEWTSNAVDVKEYVLQRSDNGSNFDQLNMFNGLTGSKIFNTTDSLKSYGNYYYRLKMIGLDGSISYSNVAQVTYFDKNRVVYYNASSDQIHIYLPANKGYNYSIFESTGKRLIHLQNATGNLQINMSGYSRGLYILKIEEPGNLYQTFKFIR